MDHSKECYYATSYNYTTGKNDILLVKEDSAADISLINEKIALAFGMRIREASEPLLARGATGSWTASKFVEITLSGPRRSESYPFFLAHPEHPIQGITAGTDFVKKVDHCSKFCYTERPKPTLVLLQQRVTVNAHAHPFQG